MRRPAGLFAGVLWIGLLWCLAVASASAAVTWDKRAGELAPVPPLKARVTDLTGTLGTEQVAALEKRLADAEAKTGNQVAVLLVPSTQPEAIEEYSIRVAEQWKLGQAGVDNGVILLVAKNDRRMRIEVGHGIEGSLPDALARRILDEAVAPRFRTGDYAGGITAAVDRIHQALAGGAPVTAPGAKVGPQAPGESLEGMRDVMFQMLLIGIFAAPILGGTLRALLGRFLGSLAGGAIFGVLVWYVTGSLLLAIAGALVGLVLIAGTSGVPGRVAHRRGGGHWGGGGSGGSWGGGSSGGWSGGGGSFGGGGASGRW